MIAVLKIITLVGLMALFIMNMRIDKKRVERIAILEADLINLISALDERHGKIYQSFQNVDNGIMALANAVDERHAKIYETMNERHQMLGKAIVTVIDVVAPNLWREDSKKPNLRMVDDEDCKGTDD